MAFQEGYVYHIKDEYFAKANDEKLMQNKEGGSYRPTFLCIEDKKNAGLLWVVPMSSRVEKFQAIRDKQEAKYGNCLTIVIGDFDGKKSAFLLQNMFPITEQYLDHVHTRNGNPVPVKYSLSQEIRSNMQQLRQLILKGKQVVFPDIQRLENLMLEELHQIGCSHNQQNTITPIKQSMKERIAAAQIEAVRRNSAASIKEQSPPHKDNR